MTTLARTSSGLLLSDDFNRANGSPGANYDSASGTWSITSNKLAYASGTPLIRVVGIDAADVVVQLKRPFVNSSDYGGMRLRRSASGNSFIMCDMGTDTGGARCRIYRWNGSTFVLIAVSSIINTATYSGAYVWKIVLIGTTCSFYLDGALMCTGSVSAASGTAGDNRIWLGGTASVGNSFDDLVVCSDNSETCTGMASGWKFRAAGTTVTESGGTAAVGTAGTLFPLSLVELLDASNAVQATYSGSVWGGDVFTIPSPNAPSVSVTQSRRTSVYVTAGAYSHPGGATQADRQARVRRVSDSTIEVAAASVALSGGFYLTGLPEGPEGAGGRPALDPDLVVEVRDKDQFNNWGAWGTSSAFQTLNLWESGEFVVHFDLLIERPEGAGTVMQSYADFGGKYWIKSWLINPATVDTPIGSATFTLFRQIDGVSIATLMTGSVLNQDGGDFAPALDFGREVEARICIMPKGEEPDSSDWLAGFHWRGLTDDIDWPRKTGDITVPCRDYSGRLYDTMMRSEARYGDPDTPVDAFAVMQDYVDAHMGAGQYVLDDLTTGDRFLVKSWIPKDVKVWEGLQQVALQWGGKSIRQVDGPTESKVSIIEPDRTATTADYGVAPRVYLEVNAISTDGANLRTIVRGRCVDTATGEILTSQLPAEEDVDTDPLVDLYGPLFLQFDEDQASAIDTQAELDAMVAAAYADVSTPPFPVEVETKFAGFASIDQMVGWGANGLLWDETLISAVISLSHSGDAPGVGRTRWRGAGAQKGHWREWTRRGVDVAGIGKRPSIFSMTLTHDPVGTLNAEVDYNEQVERFRAWDKVGESPVTAGVPDDTYGQGEYPRPVRVASWSVKNGVHYVHVRAYAADRWVPVSDTIAIVGVGPGSGEIPIDTPRTPFLERGAVDGGDQSVLASWLNTNTVDAIELKYFIDGVEDPGGLVSLAAGVSTDERAYPIGSRVTMEGRYTAGPVLEGGWSPMSNEVFLPGSLP